MISLWNDQLHYISIKSNVKIIRLLPHKVYGWSVMAMASIECESMIIIGISMIMIIGTGYRSWDACALKLETDREGRRLWCIFAIIVIPNSNCWLLSYTVKVDSTGGKRKKLFIAIVKPLMAALDISYVNNYVLVYIVLLLRVYIKLL